MLLKCSPLYLLSMLQLVVLSGIVAAYSNSYHQTPPPQTATASTTTSRNRLPINGRTVSTDVKSGVMLRPVSLSYLRDNLEKVSSLVDFVRLFTIPGTPDHHINHLISRTIRSASYPNMNHPRHNDDSNADFSGVDENNGEHDVVNDDFMSFDTPNTVENGMGEDASNARDLANHYYDYEEPQEEPSTDDLEAFEAALHNIEDTKTDPAYKCQRPTPFVHRVQDPHDDSQVFFPECVILHRCMNHSGCCEDSDLECAPKSMNIIVKSFLVVNRLSLHDEDVMYDAHMAKMLSFVNHTECECRQRSRPPECTQECPTLFHLTQEQTQCICDCFSLAGEDLWNCEIVRDGVKPLSEDGLECIRSGNCYQPRCAEGEFDVSSGYCPLTDQYALPSFTFANPSDRHHYREHLRDVNFPNLYAKSASIVTDSIISPTPTSNSDGLSQTITDELKNVEHVISPKASVNPTQTLSEISETSHVSFTDSSETVSAAATDLPRTTEADVSSQKSINEPQSSEYPSCDDDNNDINDCDNCDDDFCGELSSELIEGQSALDSTSQVKGIQKGIADKTVREVFGDATVLQTKDTNSGRKTSPNLPSYLDSLLPVGYRQDVVSVKDDDDNDNDDDEHIDNDDSSNSDYTDSSYKDYQTDSSSTDYYKDAQDVSNTNYIKDSLSADYHTDSSFDPPRKDVHKDSSKKDHHEDPSVDDHHEDPSFEDHRKDSPSKDQTQEKRQSAQNNSLRHKFQTDSQFHETVHSSETTEKGQTGGQNINSEYRVLTAVPTVPSIASSDASLPSTKLPKKSVPSQASSPSSILSSLSPQTASTPSRLSLLFSLTTNPEAQHLETSTGTWLPNNQDLKTSTEKSFLRRLYTDHDASTDGSRGDGG